MAEQDGSSQPQPIQIEHPIPRRSTFSLTPLSTNDSSRSEPPSPYDDVSSPSSSRPSFDSGPSHLTPSESRLSNGNGNSHSNGGTPQKTRSILNLTSSTLFGIYSSGYDSNQTESSTPWGTGAQTPLRNGSFDVASARLTAESVKDRARQRRKESLGQLQRPRSLSGNKHKRSGSHFRRMLSLLWRAAILFFLGMAYGEFVTRLHDTEEVAPVQVRGINRRSWPYLIFWGTSAVITGSLLPWMDRRQAQASCEAENVDTPISRDGEKELEVPAKGNTGQASNGLGADWNPIVRTVGAFVGIAFAIRRLPWQSTLQVSLTLALVNPFIWYLIDRSRAGFALSLVVGISGAAALLSINPDIVPSPAAPKLTQTLLVSGVTSETIGVATWISSVLFCSCVCFGNVGRRLNRAEADFM